MIRPDVGQFFITVAPAEFLDGKHVVFGKIVEGGESMLVLRKIENASTGAGNRPKLAVKITGKHIYLLTV